MNSYTPYTTTSKQALCERLGTEIHNLEAGGNNGKINVQAVHCGKHR
jgi:hypothetical protein